MIPNRTDADDVMQETNVILLRKFSDFQLGSNFRAWACKIARYEVLKYRERSGRQSKYFCQEVIEEIAEVALERADVLQQRSDALSICLRKLREQDKELIRSRYDNGTSIKIIAEQEGRSSDAIYKTLRRIHRSLMDCVQRSVSSQGQA